MMKFLFGAVLLVLTTASSLKVYVVPHSHCDAGWIKTFDDYYASEVDGMLSSITTALRADPSRVFNWAEISYFHRWFSQQSSETQSNVKTLVAQRRLGFVGGGWVQSDEAVASPWARVAQMTEGHEWLKQEFGEIAVPSTAWQIDVFGGSSVSPRLFNAAGYTALVNERIPFDQQSNWTMEHDLQFTWKAQDEKVSIFTHNLGDPVNDYCTPGDPPPATGGEQGFDWESDKWDLNPNITSTNVEERSAVLVQVFKARSQQYREGVPLMFPFGCDFRFQDAERQFRNMDQLIQYINSNPSYGVDVSYGLVDTFIEETLSSGSEWPSYDGDFLPYNNAMKSGFWSGFFSSQIFIKQKSRRTESLIRDADIALTLASMTVDVDARTLTETMSASKRNMSIIQHHDAITGTSPWPTMADYSSRLDQSTRDAAQVFLSSSRALLESHGMPLEGEVQFLSPENPINARADTSFTVFNSLGWSRSEVISVPVTGATCNTIVQDTEGNALPSMMDATNQYLTFVGDLSPLAYNSFSLRPQVDDDECEPATVEPTELSTSTYDLQFNPDGSTRSLLERSSRAETDFELDVFVYMDAGSSDYSLDAKTEAQRLQQLPWCNGTSSVKSFAGKNMAGLRREFSCGIELVITSFSELAFANVELRFNSSVVPKGANIVLRAHTSLHTGGLFATDNGIDVLSHPRNSGETILERVGGTYHPAISTAMISDTRDHASLRFSSSHSMGAASLVDGEIEMMLYRKVSDWDMSSPPEMIETQLRMAFGVFKDSTAIWRDSIAMNSPPRLLQTVSQKEGDVELVNFELDGLVHLWSLERTHTSQPSLPVGIRFVNFDEERSGQVDISRWFRLPKPFPPLHQTTATFVTEIQSVGKEILTIHSKELLSFVSFERGEMPYEIVQA